MTDRDNLWLKYDKSLEEICQQARHLGRTHVNFYDFLDSDILHEVSQTTANLLLKSAGRTLTTFR